MLKVCTFDRGMKKQQFFVLTIYERLEGYFQRLSFQINNLQIIVLTTLEKGVGESFNIILVHMERAYWA